MQYYIGPVGKIPSFAAIKFARPSASLCVVAGRPVTVAGRTGDEVPAGSLADGLLRGRSLPLLAKVRRRAADEADEPHHGKGAKRVTETAVRRRRHDTRHVSIYRQNSIST